MKFSILATLLVFALAGCAGGEKKKDGKMDSSKETKAEMSKAEKKMEAKEGKKDMAKMKSSAVSVGKVECSMNNDKRFVEVREAGKGCELAYSKFGNEEVVATSLSGTEHCQKISERIVGNLENAGFSCAK
jgi:hypothetical protein